ncbi:MAG: hypothetical protein WA421_04690, partial [Nitrososphaeraceae archaeon]
YIQIRQQAQRKISPRNLIYLHFILNEVDLIYSGRIPDDFFAIRIDFHCNRIYIIISYSLLSSRLQ